MLSLVVAALVTILPDYLYRRYRQNKRLGHEITRANFWHELRWGLSAWAALTLVFWIVGGSDEPSVPDLATLPHDALPFFIAGPGQTDVLLILVAIAIVGVVVGLGVLYFWIQAWPDRLAVGASKVQLQMVGILGLISLLTLSNAFWIAGLLLATIRFPDIVTPLKDIAAALASKPAGRD